jgi:hypothetical protein
MSEFDSWLDEFEADYVTSKQQTNTVSVEVILGIVAEEEAPDHSDRSSEIVHVVVSCSIYSIKIFI